MVSGAKAKNEFPQCRGKGGSKKWASGKRGLCSTPLAGRGAAGAELGKECAGADLTRGAERRRLDLDAVDGRAGVLSSH